MGMFKRSMVLLTALAILLVAVVVSAQAPKIGPPKFFGVFASEVGGWSEYAVTEIESGKKSTMRNSIVGKEGDIFWYEVVIKDGDAQNIIKLSLKGDPNNPENIQRLIMKVGDRAAQEFPREFVLMGRRMAASMFETRSGANSIYQKDLKTEEVGTGEMQVPAGKFPVVQYRLVDGAGKVLATYAYNKNVFPLGVIGSETDKVKIELLAYGKDATSQITEVPEMMPSPPAMPPGTPRGLPPGMPSSGPASGGPAPPKGPATGAYGK